MIIPEMGHWVCCTNMDEGPGKVTRLDFDRNEFTADFLVEPSSMGEPNTAEITLSFSKIEKIIEEQGEVEKLENELRGG